MKKKDIEAIRRVIRYVSTSDPTLQKEILRIDDMLAEMLKPKTKEETK